MYITEVNVFFESESYRVPEDGGSVTVCVLKDERVADSFTVRVATTNLTPVQAEGGYPSLCVFALFISYHIVLTLMSQMYPSF